MESVIRVPLFTEEDLIYSYTRAEALEDGTLQDVTGLAWEAGFRCTVALTEGVFDDVCNIPERQIRFQDPNGRLWDLLFMGYLAVRRKLAESGIDWHETVEILYYLTMHVGRRKIYRAKLVLGPGDNGEAVATIMRPEED